MAKAKRNELKTNEKQATKESEAQLEAGMNEQNVDETQVEAALAEAGADADAVVSAEAAAVNTDTETALEASEASEKKPAKTKAAKTVAAKPKQRSVKYVKTAAAMAEANPKSLNDVIELVKQSSYSSFDGTVELHAQMIVKKKEAADGIRALIALPNGSPRQVNAVVLTDALIEEIATTKKIAADLYLATPAMMPKVAKIARILGPQGKMPNPKTGTVTEDPAAAMKEIQSGRVEYRADSEGIVHIGIGKVSWPTEKIAGNVMALLQSIGMNRLRSVTLASTMGPGIAVDLTRLDA